jgi:phosphate transport system protein
MSDVPGTELRRSYHDRIAELRGRTAAIIRGAADATEEVTSAFLDGDREKGRQIAAGTAQAAAGIAVVEGDVLDLLALQAPVARDLRVILAARDVAHAGELCLGLCRGLAGRVGGAQDLLSTTLRSRIDDMGSSTVDLLRRANGAWVTLDVEQAASVLEAADTCRQLQRAFLAALLELRLAPVDAAVDLGMVGRVYERLTDHSVEIAGRVVFVLTGARPAEGLSRSGR